MSDALPWNGELTPALTHADEVIELQPYRERGYQRLMRLPSERGDRAEALRSASGAGRSCQKSWAWTLRLRRL